MLKVQMSLYAFHLNTGVHSSKWSLPIGLSVNYRFVSRAQI